ncbi:hypothetical protein [Rubritalea profundi]|uniref:Uncharacterized protein n=1 Tax=Rubritalea profundi TaxID=1658618 RepID=A0A2S7U077_9BACT|nr:hypothetical protein [Rubritalea profundi]PQJ27871.1 hypothetical protein BSZ32_04720 [Rubritalea profundi]
MPVFFLFTLGNIALNSPWAKGYLTDVLEKKTGEVWKVGTLTLAANGVLHIYAIESQLGDGGVLVKHVSVKPNYLLALNRQLRFSEVCIEQPEVTLTDAWILEKLEAQVHDPIDGPIVATLETKKTPDREVVVGGTGSVADNSGAGSEPTVAVKKIEVKSNKSSPPVGNHDPTDFYESWLRVRGAKFNIVSKYGDILVIDGVEADLPVGGKNLTGGLAWNGLSMFDRELVSGGSIKIEKKGPILSVKETEVDFFGIKLQPDIYLGQAPQGPVFHIDMQIPEQRVEELFTHLDLTVGLSVDNIAGRMLLTGLVNHPFTWRGIADVRALNIEAKEGHRGTTAHFDSFLFRSLLDRGVVQSPNIQLRGEEVTLMSNGVLRMNGDGYGVVRLIMLPEKSSWINKLASGSGFFDGLRGTAMQPFETKDLYYMDLKVDGSILSPMMMLDKKTDWQPLWPAIIRLQSFIKDERLEEKL